MRQPRRLTSYNPQTNASGFSLLGSAAPIGCALAGVGLVSIRSATAAASGVAVMSGEFVIENGHPDGSHGIEEVAAARHDQHRVLVDLAL